MSSLLRNSTLETVFRPFPKIPFCLRRFFALWKFLSCQLPSHFQVRHASWLLRQPCPQRDHAGLQRVSSCSPPLFRAPFLTKTYSQWELISEGRKWGVRSVVVEFGVFGKPRFSVQRSPKHPILKGFWDLWTVNRGSPKTPNSTTTDLTPHLRPSDY